MDIKPISLQPPLDRRPGGGSIVVGVNGGPSGWQALDWAAAEAAGRHSPLRIVHVVAPPLVVADPLGGTGPAWIDVQASHVGAQVLDEAARRATAIAPETTVTTHLECGRVVPTLRAAGRGDALIVVGRSRGRSGVLSVSRRMARRALTPLIIVELDVERRCGPSAGRVVLGIDAAAGPPWAVACAFQAAARRGVGLTVIHAHPPVMTSVHVQPDSRRTLDHLRRLADIDDVVRTYRDVYPHVDVRRRFVQASAGTALAAESTAAALVVIGAPTHHRLRRVPFGSVGAAAVRLVHCPIQVVRAPTFSDPGGRRS